MDLFKFKQSGKELGVSIFRIKMVHYISHIKSKVVFEHEQNGQIQINLQIHTFSPGSLLSTDTFYSIREFSK